ncbi:prc-barrel domain protein [Paenibacillus sp. TCA20]|nr:prc-barrel domain protein [Paenibacillus sp. TCA20]
MKGYPQADMKLQEMIGLAVYDITVGRQIGKIVDFLLTEDWKICGIELDGRALFSGKVKTIEWGDIVAYGEDAVMIRNQQAIRHTEADDIQYSYAKGHHKLRDMPVLTREGLMLGHVTDVYFDQELGNHIISLEISDGFVTDLMEGRKWLPLVEEITLGEHAIIVPTASEQHLYRMN